MVVSSSVLVVQECSCSHHCFTVILLFIALQALRVPLKVSVRNVLNLYTNYLCISNIMLLVKFALYILILRTVLPC